MYPCPAIIMLWDHSKKEKKKEEKIIMVFSI